MCLPDNCPVGDTVLVSGGRDYANRLRLFMALEALHARHPIKRLIEGGARGADRLAREWAQSRGIPVVTLAANWTGHGDAAGSRRNVRMVVVGSPDVIVAFPGGRGTRYMVKQARVFNVPLIDLRMKLYGWVGSL